MQRREPVESPLAKSLPSLPSGLAGPFETARMAVPGRGCQTLCRLQEAAGTASARAGRRALRPGWSALSARSGSSGGSQSWREGPRALGQRRLQRRAWNSNCLRCRTFRPGAEEPRGQGSVRGCWQLGLLVRRARFRPRSRGASSSRTGGVQQGSERRAWATGQRLHSRWRDPANQLAGFGRVGAAGGPV